MDAEKVIVERRDANWILDGEAAQSSKIRELGFRPYIVTKLPAGSVDSPEISERAS
jgi:hypothetical protein